jgi:hypothetical protein
MRPRWLASLSRHLRTREGAGTLLIAVCSAVALGVVPNMLEKVKDSGWFYLAVFCCALVAVLVGWNLVQKRGVGVVVQLYPQPQESRLEQMKDDSRGRNESTLLLDRRRLTPDGRTLSLPEVLDLTAVFIDARVIEQRGPSPGAMSAPSSEVSLYPLAPMRDGFLLGRRLSHERHDLTIMHIEGAAIYPGVLLSPGLQAPLTAEERTLAESLLEDVATPVTPTPFPGVPPEHRHRLAMLVRLSPAHEMIATSREVARTGSVRRPNTGNHTGYVFDADDTEADGTPCGAYLTIEVKADRLPDQAAFEAVTKYIHRTWQQAHNAWAAHCGTSDIETRFFFMGPLPIAIALGWLTARDTADLVHHVPRLAGSPRPVTGTP